MITLSIAAFLLSVLPKGRLIPLSALQTSASSVGEG